MRILIAEDEESIRLALKEVLTAEGYEVREADDGEETIDKLRSYKPNLLILDIVMPKKDGLDVLNAIAADKEISEVPILVLSNKADFSTQQKTLSAGVKYYFVKASISLEDIVAKVKEIIPLES